MSLKGIDVSSYNGKIDWTKTKNAVDFAILRCHQRNGIDETFKTNYKGCTDNGIPVGVYKYCYALSTTAAKKEAKEVLKVLRNKRLQYPVFYDLEFDELAKLGREKIQKITLAFLRAIIKEGYGVGIYCNKNWYDNYISDTLKKYYQFWIASYPVNDTGDIQERLKPSGVFGWQYSSAGVIPGVTGNVDLNLFYISDNSSQESTPAFTSTPGITATDALIVARSWLGLNEADGSHKSIIDLYNSYTPRARGYAVQYTDAWCDTMISAIFIKLGAVDKIGGTECGVESHVQLFKNAGIWYEDGTITPKPGDLIVYNWDDSTQPNDGYSDHIGIVETVSGDTMTTIEGNRSNAVRRVSVPIAYGYIRGFARPKYD